MLTATSEAGLGNHFLVLDAMQCRIGEPGFELDAGTFSGIQTWLDDFRIAVAQPDDSAAITALLEPLPETVQQTLADMDDVVLKIIQGG